MATNIGRAIKAINSNAEFSIMENDINQILLDLYDTNFFSDIKLPHTPIIGIMYVWPLCIDIMKEDLMMI